MSINRDDWLKALAGVTPELDEGAMTTTEIAAMLGLCRTAAKDRIRKLLADGRAIATNKRMTDTGGRPQIVRAYRLLPAATLAAPARRRRA